MSVSSFRGPPQQDIDHLSIATVFTQHMSLQATEAVGHFYEWRAIAQSSWFALERAIDRHWSEDDGERQIVTPVIDDPARLAVRPLYDPVMGANSLTFSNHDQLLWVNMQADAPVRKAGWDAVAVALEGDQARWGYPFAVFYKAVKGWRQGHQCRLLGLPSISD